MVIELWVVQFWSEIMLVISNRTRAARSFDLEITRMISDLIIHMKKLLDSDWLRAVQFKCNTSAKRSGSCNFSFLKNSLVQINSKLNSKPYDYLYKLLSTQFNYHFQSVGLPL